MKPLLLKNSTASLSAYAAIVSYEPMMVGSLRVCDIKIILTSISDSKLQKYNMQGGGGVLPLGALTRLTCMLAFEKCKLHKQGHECT